MTPLHVRMVNPHVRGALPCATPLTRTFCRGKGSPRHILPAPIEISYNIASSWRVRSAPVAPFSSAAVCRPRCRCRTTNPRSPTRILTLTRPCAFLAFLPHLASASVSLLQRAFSAGVSTQAACRRRCRCRVLPALLPAPSRRAACRPPNRRPLRPFVVRAACHRRCR